FRQAGLSLAHLFYLSWKGIADRIGGWVARLKGEVDDLLSARLPESVMISKSEGYAFYSLYPETYLEAAIKYFRQNRPDHVICIGIRSIGASLSAVVGATLEECGVAVDSYTVRPRGHPYHRRLQVDQRIAAVWNSLAGVHFVIVDEGPGLSGSSFASVAEK